MAFDTLQNQKTLIGPSDKKKLMFYNQPFQKKDNLPRFEARITFAGKFVLKTL